MNKKEKRIAAQNALLSKVYNLILNTQTLDDERSKLIKFKMQLRMEKISSNN